jgi:hypothetical protein
MTFRSQTPNSKSSDYIARPDKAIAGVRSFRGPVIVDLDETLYLRNSTEDFLDSACPSIVAFCLLRALDLLAPWQLTGGRSTRDNWRVLCVLVIMPWTIWIWRKRARILGARFCNRPLLAATQEHQGKSVIVSNGYEFIARPLVSALGAGGLDLVCCRLLAFQDRYSGKLALAKASLGDQVIGSSLVVTDSLDDLQLLQACEAPHCTKWPAAAYRPAFSTTYVPGRYLTSVKRPGQKYILNGIIKDDFLLWVFCSIFLSEEKGRLILGLIFLAISFWTVYELGYADNDQVGARYEKDPTLSAEFVTREISVSLWRAAVWAFLCALIGVITIHGISDLSTIVLAQFLGVLSITFLFFCVYNRCDTATRVWLYPGLRLARYAVFTAVVPIPVVAGISIASKIFACWMPYYLYRSGTSAFPGEPVHLIAFVMLLIQWGMLCICNGGITVLENWTAVALFVLFAFKIRREFLGVISASTIISRS